MKSPVSRKCSRRWAATDGIRDQERASMSWISGFSKMPLCSCLVFPGLLLSRLHARRTTYAHTESPQHRLGNCCCMECNSGVSWRDRLVYAHGDSPSLALYKRPYRTSPLVVLFVRLTVCRTLPIFFVSSWTKILHVTRNTDISIFHVLYFASSPFTPPSLSLQVVDLRQVTVT